MLDRLGDLLEVRRHELAALQCWEVGKPIREAEADVGEAVDYCRYYARQAVQELGHRQLGDLPGEENVLAWQGRGVAGVIAPWNFPLAILCGMTTAALVAGNSVVMKPAEQSSAVAWRLFTLMREAGFPDGTVQFLPGVGEEVGRLLVAHPSVAQVAFTGSRSVGLSILARAGEVAAGQRMVKRVVCEMGGKNAIIVDDDADLDEAVQGVVRSAFGYAGQKCSACSRAIVLARAWDRFVPRLVEACRSLVMAPAHEPRCELGPVIDETAWKRLRSVISDPGPGAERLFLGESREDGLYVPPAIFEVSGTSHRLMQEELFGPVLALLRVPDFDAALGAAADSLYALTGGLYSRSPSRQAEARRRFLVGNLYLNRPITGAIVGRQPFGGFAMSGTGTKAGGPGYVALYADPRTTCENTMRRGFVPGLP